MCDADLDNYGVELRSLKTGLAEESLSALYSVVIKSGKRPHERAGADVLPDSAEHERPAGVISKVIFIGYTNYQLYFRLLNIFLLSRLRLLQIMLLAPVKITFLAS